LRLISVTQFLKENFGTWGNLLMRLQADWWRDCGLILSRVKEFYLLSRMLTLSLGPTDIMQGVPGALPSRLKWSGCQADHWPPSIGDIKNEWSCSSIPACTFMAWPGTTLFLPLSLGKCWNGILNWGMGTSYHNLSNSVFRTYSAIWCCITLALKSVVYLWLWKSLTNKKEFLNFSIAFPPPPPHGSHCVKYPLSTDSWPSGVSFLYDW